MSNVSTRLSMMALWQGYIDCLTFFAVRQTHHTAMLPIIPFLIGAIPILTFASFCGIAIYCLISEKKHKQQLSKFYNHPDKDRPLYNMGHCDRYSAGTFSW